MVVRGDPAMSRTQADPSLREALARASQETEVVDDRGRIVGHADVELVDEWGRVVGYAVTPEEMNRIRQARQLWRDMYDSADALVDPEALRAAEADPRRYTTEEVMKLFDRECGGGDKPPGLSP
jgi:hypothetical protein